MLFQPLVDGLLPFSQSVLEEVASRVANVVAGALGVGVLDLDILAPQLATGLFVHSAGPVVVDCTAGEKQERKFPLSSSY